MLKAGGGHEWETRCKSHLFGKPSWWILVDFSLRKKTGDLTLLAMMELV